MKLGKSKTGIRLAKIESDIYPSLLKEIPNPPRLLYHLGNIPSSGKPMVAVVGTRKATAAGKMLARRIAKELASRDIIIVSGLALGIDVAAHEGALDVESKTVAVLANGLDSIYPKQNEKIAERIIESGGVILSEYKTGVPNFPSQFLKRNRIISGLCAATVIIEAPLKSGALVTARFAAEQGREVFVFPGPPNHPNYAGSHKLIRDGARLVTSTVDILEDLGWETSAPEFNPQKEIKMAEIFGEDQLRILEVVKKAGGPVRIDKIIELTKLEPQVVNSALTLLVIKSLIKETEGGFIL